MRTAVSRAALSTCLLVTAVRADDDSKTEELELAQIKSLDEVQGRWTLAPEGIGMFAGHTLEIKGSKGQYREFTDDGRRVHEPVEFDVEVVRGVLVLKTDDPFVEAKKWHLAQLGKYKCIVALVAKTKLSPAPFSADAPVLYFRPARQKVTQDAAPFKSRRPPPRVGRRNSN